MRHLFLAALCAALPVTALSATTLSAATAAPSHPPRLLAMTPESFRTAATIHDDALEDHLTISTEKGYRSGASLFRTSVEDNHLRAQVDRRTGQTRFEVRHSARHFGDPRTFDGAHYASPDGVQRTALTEQRAADGNCPAAEDDNFQCAASRHLAFAVDEATLRAVAASYAPGNAGGLHFKFKAQDGKDLRSAIVPAEAAGLLQAVDAYRATLQAS